MDLFKTTTSLSDRDHFSLSQLLEFLLFLISYRRPLDAWFDLCGGLLYEFPSHIIRKNLSVSVRIYKCHPNIKNFVFFFQLHPVITIIVIVIIIILCQFFFFSLICRLCISLIYLFLFISLGEASDYDLYFPQKTLTSYVHQSWFANLSMFTVCFWMKTDDLSEGTTFSYAIRKPCCNEITLFKRHLAIQNQNRYTSLVVVILLIRNPSQFPCW